MVTVVRDEEVTLPRPHPVLQANRWDGEGWVDFMVAKTDGDLRRARHLMLTRRDWAGRAARFRWR